MLIFWVKVRASRARCPGDPSTEVKHGGTLTGATHRRHNAVHTPFKGSETTMHRQRHVLHTPRETPREHIHTHTRLTHTHTARLCTTRSRQRCLGWRREERREGGERERGRDTSVFALSIKVMRCRVDQTPAVVCVGLWGRVCWRFVGTCV